MVKLFNYTLRKVRIENKGIRLYWFKYKPKPIRSKIQRVSKALIKNNERIKARIEEEKMKRDGVKFLEQFNEGVANG